MLLDLYSLLYGITPYYIFGRDLKRWYNERYDQTTGIWIDESGHANTSQSVPAHRSPAGTLNGHVCIDQTNLSNVGLNSGGADNTISNTGEEICLFAVATNHSASNGQSIFAKYADFNAYQLGFPNPLDAGGNYLHAFVGNDAQRATTTYPVADDDAVHVYVFVHDGNGSRLYMDGALQAFTDSTAGVLVPSSPDFLSVGCIMAGTDQPIVSWNGKIGCVGAVGRAPTTFELALLHAYLLPWAGVHVGPIAATLGSIQQSALGAEVFAGTAAQKFGALRQSASGLLTFSGTAAQKVGQLRQSANGAETFSGTAAQTVGGLRQSATGAEVFSGTAAQKVGGLRQAASGAETFSASAAQRLGGLRQSATGAEVFSGSAVQRISSIAQQASASLAFSGTASARLHGLGQAAAGAETFAGSTSQRVGSLQQQAAGHVSASEGAIFGDVSQRLGSLQQAGIGTVAHAAATYVASGGGGPPANFFPFTIVQGSTASPPPPSLELVAVTPQVVSKRKPSHASATASPPASTTADGPSRPALDTTSHASAHHIGVELCRPCAEGVVAPAPPQFVFGFQPGSPSLESHTATEVVQIAVDRPPRDLGRATRLSDRRDLQTWRTQERERNLAARTAARRRVA